MELASDFPAPHTPGRRSLPDALACELRVMSRIYEAWQKSPLLAAKVAMDRVAEYIEERRLGIRTAGHIRIESLVENPRENHDYTPTSIRALRRIFDHAGIAPGSETLVDYGCGMGRVLAIACEYPFRRALGIEISPDLVRIAQRNLARFRGNRKCTHVEFWTGSAEQFPIPPDATFFFFFNPFGGDVLTRVFSRIGSSFRDHPRRLRIVYVNPHAFQRIAPDYPWIRISSTFSFEHECIIYEAGP